MRLGFSRHIFEKGLVYQISWKSVQWEPSYSTRTDGETWRSYRPLFATSRTRLKILTKFRSAALSGLRPPGSKHGWHWLSWARQRPLDRIWIPTCDKVRMLAKDKWNEYNSTTAELQILKWFTWTQRLSHHTREQIPSHCHHHHCRLQYNAQTVAASIKVPPRSPDHASWLLPAGCMFPASPNPSHFISPHGARSSHTHYSPAGTSVSKANLFHSCYMISPPQPGNFNYHRQTR